MGDDIIRVDVVAGVEGPSLYLNDFRIAGPKPWGGGTITHTFRPRRDMVAESVAPSLKAENERLRAALRFYADEWEQDADMVFTPNGPMLDGQIGDVEPTARLRGDAGDIARNALGEKPDG